MTSPRGLPKRSSAPARASGPCERPTLPDQKGGAPVPVDLAIEKGMGLRHPVSSETIAIENASGRILARDLMASAPLPGFDSSAMDGYAVNVEDLAGPLPATLRLIGRIAAGPTKEETRLEAGTAIRILTGAPIPPGANAVVAQEDAEPGDGNVVFSHPPRRGANIRLRGEDVQAGTILIEHGSQMDSRMMGLAASTGLAQVEVFRKLRVATFSTGSELRQPGEAIAPGEIYNSNRYILRGLLDQPWIDLIDLGACHDAPDALCARMREAAAQADAVITTGGVSVGDEDHMAEVVRRCDGTITVAGVAIKPGKPLTLGRVGEAAYLGLPGNPGAVFTTVRVVVAGLLRAWGGVKRPMEPVRPAIADFPWASPSGRSTYLPAILKGYTANGAPLVDLLPKANSGKLFLLSQADGFVVLGSDCGSVMPGNTVGWLPL